MDSLQLKCSCGKVRGEILEVAPNSGIHLVCYCDSCQRFQETLGCAEAFLNEHGGTEIYQTAPSRIKITEGQEHIRCLKLTKKGPLRWYASCCNTPIGNTMKASMPFVGIIQSFVDADETKRQEVMGPIIAEVQTTHAYDSLPDHIKPVGFPIGITLKIMSKILFWKLRGFARPSPFFDAEGTPLSKPERLSSS